MNDIQLISVSLKLSEGSNRENVNQITQLVDHRENVRLLDVRFREKGNYTLIKLAGVPEDVFALLMEMAEKAFSLIRFNEYSGDAAVVGIFSHLTVSPVRNISLDECDELTREFVQSYAQQFNAPCFFFPHHISNSSQEEIFRRERKTLRASVEKGEITVSYGSTGRMDEIGFTMVRVHKYIVYYSIVLESSKLEIAQNIADELGRQGRVILDKNGLPKKDREGNILRSKGRFATVDALAYSFGSGEQTQIIFNLKDYENPTVIKLFNAAVDLCREELIEIVGSRFLNAIPFVVVSAAVSDVGKIQQKKALDVVQQIQFLRNYLKLDEVGEFLPEYHIIDFRFLPFPSPDSGA